MARNPEHPVDLLFVERWSPRAMSAEAISDAELMTLFEAARWAPSSSNNQPWRFIYAKRDTPAWQPLFDLMVEFNQSWTKNAAVLVVIVSKNDDDKGRPMRTHTFDTGSAWMSLALQGSLKGLVVHGMAGFDYDKAKATLGLPDNYTVEAMAAIGKPGEVSTLPAGLQKRESPSDRKKVSEFVFEGKFPA